MNGVADRLQLLSILHYVLAALGAVFSLFPLIHVCFGLAIFADRGFGQEAPPAMFGLMMAIVGGVFVLGGLLLATLIFINARLLARRKRYKACQVIAAVECILIPFGTALGVFTLVTLLSDPARQEFGQPTRPAPPRQSAPPPPSPSDRTPPSSSHE